MAEALLSTIFEAGVFPRVTQSDNGREFANSLMSEIAQLAGARQIFSMALHPQSQGIDERIHQEIRGVLAILVDSLCRAAPAKWPRLTAMVEHRLRHRCIADTGITPYALTHGFYGASALETALDRVAQIPPGAAHHAWLREVIETACVLTDRINTHFEQVDASRRLTHDETKNQRRYEVGELVMVGRARSERQGTLLPRMDGPYRVLAVPDDYGVLLADPVTGEPLQHSQATELPSPDAQYSRFRVTRSQSRSNLGPDHLTVGQLVVVDVKGQALKRDIRVARIAAEPEDGQITLELFAVPVPDRNGPWGGRRWATESYGVGTLPTARVLCHADVSADRAFTDRCMEALRLTGVTL